MFHLKTENLIKCLNGCEKNLKLKTSKIKKIVTNHSYAEPGSVFVALKGKNFDGHNFVKQAISLGAEFAVVEHLQQTVPQIVVKNTVQAILNIAALNRQHFKGPLIAVTGSAGKTTTKDLISLTLSTSENVLKTEKNLNNEIGLAQTLLNLNTHHTAAVTEMGMSHAGEIKKMSLAAKPTICVLTNIGSAHFQNFKNLNEILKARLEILEGMDENGTIVFNADDEKLKAHNFGNIKTISCSIKNSNADIFASEIEQFENLVSFKINFKADNNQSIKIKLPLIGLHNVLNTLFSFAVANILKINLINAAQKLETFTPTGLRQKILIHENIKIIADCYNASPEPMKTTLQAISQTPCSGQKIAVLGDMLELGQIAIKEHEKIGELLNNLQFNKILCIGNLTKHIVKTTKKPSFHFKSATQLTEFLKNSLKPNDLILFKASRAINLENILKKVFNDLKLD